MKHDVSFNRRYTGSTQSFFHLPELSSEKRITKFQYTTRAFTVIFLLSTSKPDQVRKITFLLPNLSQSGKHPMSHTASPTAPYSRTTIKDIPQKQSSRFVCFKNVGSAELIFEEDIVVHTCIEQDAEPIYHYPSVIKHSSSTPSSPPPINPLAEEPQPYPTIPPQ